MNSVSSRASSNNPYVTSFTRVYRFAHSVRFVILTLGFVAAACAISIWQWSVVSEVSRLQTSQLCDDDELTSRTASASSTLCRQYVQWLKRVSEAAPVSFSSQLAVWVPESHPEVYAANGTVSLAVLQWDAASVTDVLHSNGACDVHWDGVPTMRWKLNEASIVECTHCDKRQSYQWNATHPPSQTHRLYHWRLDTRVSLSKTTMSTVTNLWHSLALCQRALSTNGISLTRGTYQWPVRWDTGREHPVNSDSVDVRICTDHLPCATLPSHRNNSADNNVGVDFDKRHLPSDSGWCLWMVALCCVQYVVTTRHDSRGVTSVRLLCILCSLGVWYALITSVSFVMPYARVRMYHYAVRWAVWSSIWCGWLGSDRFRTAPPIALITKRANNNNSNNNHSSHVIAIAPSTRRRNSGDGGDDDNNAQPPIELYRFGDMCSSQIVRYLHALQPAISLLCVMGVYAVATFPIQPLSVVLLWTTATGAWAMCAGMTWFALAWIHDERRKRMLTDSAMALVVGVYHWVKLKTIPTDTPPPPPPQKPNNDGYAKLPTLATHLQWWYPPHGPPRTMTTRTLLHTTGRVFVFFATGWQRMLFRGASLLWIMAAFVGIGFAWWDPDSCMSIATDHTTIGPTSFTMMSSSLSPLAANTSLLSLGAAQTSDFSRRLVEMCNNEDASPTDALDAESYEALVFSVCPDAAPFITTGSTHASAYIHYTTDTSAIVVRWGRPQPEWWWRRLSQLTSDTTSVTTTMTINSDTPQLFGAAKSIDYALPVHCETRLVYTWTSLLRHTGIIIATVWLLPTEWLLPTVCVWVANTGHLEWMRWLVCNWWIDRCTDVTHVVWMYELALCAWMITRSIQPVWMDAKLAHSDVHHLGPTVGDVLLHTGWMIVWIAWLCAMRDTEVSFHVLSCVLFLIHMAVWSYYTQYPPDEVRSASHFRQ
jgi:hypothetical protein